MSDFLCPEHQLLEQYGFKFEIRPAGDGKAPDFIVSSPNGTKIKYRARNQKWWIQGKVRSNGFWRMIDWLKEH